MSRAILASFITNREFIREMVLRDLRARNQGAVLGYLWLIIRPLLQTALYVALIGFVFHGKLAQDSHTLNYLLYVLSGMVPWQIVVKCLEDGPSLIRDRMDLVKQVLYPIETLPVNSLALASVGAGATLAIYVPLALYAGALSWTVVLSPVYLAFLVAFVLGSSWILMIAGVVLKDLREIVATVLALLVYLSPVVMSPEIVGATVWQLILLNPLAHVVICFRDVLTGQLHLVSWVWFGTMSFALMAAGSLLLGRARMHINEYI